MKVKTNCETMPLKLRVSPSGRPLLRRKLVNELCAFGVYASSQL